MPRVEVVAQWTLPDGIYESMIGSIGLSEAALTNPKSREIVLTALATLIDDATRFEAGPVTDMAQKVL